VPKLWKLAQAIADQVDSNRSGIGHEAQFAGHRANLTREIRARAPAGGGGRLCLLGAGNANDVDLEDLAAHYREIHLVDVDAEALGRASARTTAARRRQLVLHAPVDVSGIFDKLERWAVTPPDAPTLAGAVTTAVDEVGKTLPGPFDVVVSCCILTQLQLVLLNVVGDQNPRFDDLRAALNRIQVRSLAGLLAPEGVGLLVTDLTPNNLFPLDDLTPDTDLAALMGHLIGAGSIIYAAHPGLLSAEIRRDPELRQHFAVHFPVGPWIWHNGPAHTFLVYGLEIRRLKTSPSGPR
jgi:hypothetical protein